jgi:ferric-dicitrate binding protein FerR (iron transport regulator)
MTDVKKEADGVTTRARDAVEWVVENESDHELDLDAVLEWEEWCTHAWNNAAYVRIIKMRRQLPLLPAPTFASRGDLLRDARAESGTESYES